MEFVTLCKSLHATDSVCERAWTLWKTVQDVMEDVDVCITNCPSCHFVMLGP